MTDNEKRAHDLAIAMLPTLYNEQPRETTDILGENETYNDVDPVNLYLSTYEKALDAFNQRWPDQRN